MRLPFLSKLQGLFKKPTERKKPYLSLIFSSEDVAGACWYVLPSGVADVTHAVIRKIDSDSWEDRIIAADEVIGALEERLGDEQFDDVILGLPAMYLTGEGDILSDIRQHIKEATKQLDLHAIGFVSVNQAIVYHLKKDAGIPPTVILIQVTESAVWVFLYTSGHFKGAERADSTAAGVSGIEDALRRIGSNKDLPAKMILYGTDQNRLVKLKEDLIGYPWMSKLSFTHFPKIEVLPSDYIVTSVSIAGAGEMVTSEGKMNGLGPEHEEEHPAPQTETETETEAETEAVDDDEDLTIGDQIEETDMPQIDTVETQEHVQNVENIQIVQPESLGFQNGKDVLEAPEELSREEPEPEKKKIHVRRISMPSIHIPRVKGIIIIACVLVLLAGFGIWIILSVLPRANVTVVVEAKELNATVPVVINPSVATVQSDKKIIPGKKIEQTVRGDATVPATGKKKVGTSARGSVIIYNKTVSDKTFKKGTVLLSGGAKFTLDNDISIASASESIGSITFGKTSANLTAVEIGSNGNISTGSEFVFKEVADSVASARSDQAFTGGTSRDVTVVSRTDYDALVKEVSSQLIKKVINDLGASSSATIKLIESTVKTSVTGKKFSAEIDDEAKSVTGTLSVTATGIGYDQNDMDTVVRGTIQAEVPGQYMLEEDTVLGTADKFVVKKDGTVSCVVSVVASATPQLDISRIVSLIGAKKITDGLAEVKRVSGVSDVTYVLKNSMLKTSFPRASHITVQIQVNH